MNRMKWLWLALVLVSASAWAAGPGAVRKQVEASMLVTGEIDIAPDGAVSAYRLDDLDKLPSAATELLDKSIPGWRFKPVLVEGRPAAVRSRINVRLRARKVDEERYVVEIAGAHFGSHTDDDVPTSKRLTPPGYPQELAEAGVGGIVYLVIKVARDGSVEDVMAEQVDLKTVASQPRMRRMRDRLEQVAVSVARRRWAFNPPVKPDDAPHWLVRVPVEFIAPGRRLAKYGEWTAYVPGPRQANPWSQDDEDVSPDTLVAGGVYPVGQSGPKLLTSLDPS